jgi:hypothetical protein
VGLGAILDWRRAGCLGCPRTGLFDFLGGGAGWIGGAWRYGLEQAGSGCKGIGWDELTCGGKGIGWDELICGGKGTGWDELTCGGKGIGCDPLTFATFGESGLS